MPSWSAEALIALEASPAATKIAPWLIQQYRVSGIEHDELCVKRGVLDVLFQIVDYVLKARPWMSGLRVGGIAGILRRRVLGLFGVDSSKRRSAQIELRVAQWLAESGKHVIVNPEPDDGVSLADLTVDGVYIDVKFSDKAGGVRLREHIRDGFNQADEVILVRASGATLSRAEYDAIRSELLAEHPGKVLKIIEEKVLPPWEWGI